MTAERDNVEACASQEATDWLILLQDEPDDLDLRRRFEGWLATDPANAAAWAATRHAAGLLAQMPPAHTDPASFATATRTVGIRRRGWQLGFGMVVVTACLAVLAAPSIMLRVHADHATGTAQMRTLTLADGSTVVLAPDSALSVAYSDGERRVTLLAGEAFFTVTHNPNRPFRVAIGGIETTDIGTAFNIRRTDDGAAIEVQKGGVRVDYRTASSAVSETLGPRQTLHVDWSGTVLRGREPGDQIAAWRQHQLIAENQPTREVIDRLRPYFPGKILVANASLESRPVTGVYNLADPVEALRGIAEVHGASVYRISPWILVVSGG